MAPFLYTVSGGTYGLWLAFSSKHLSAWLQLHRYTSRAKDAFRQQAVAARNHAQLFAAAIGVSDG